ncbi:MAG: hypothetical protein JKY37_01755 [Nannocystaceae bacterium]|nr:hypothetical protein [Nannocystaceae bacterium]
MHRRRYQHGKLHRRSGSAFIAVWLVACVPPDSLPPPNPSADSSGTTGLASADPSGSGDAPGRVLSESDGGSSEGGNMFLIQPDGGASGAQECSIWEEDCPPGEKCMPWANDGGTWNATRCSPIARDAAGPGEPCGVRQGIGSGLDSCELHAMCWFVDAETLEGTCVALCVGGRDAPYCEDPAATCPITSNGWLLPCLPRCNPLLDDCPAGHGCYPQPSGLLCAPDASGRDGAAGDHCGFINVCDPGNACVDGDTVPGCSDSCCSAWCALDEPTASQCLPEQACVPWFDKGEAPAGLEFLGICLLPQ